MEGPDAGTISKWAAALAAAAYGVMRFVIDLRRLFKSKDGGMVSLDIGGAPDMIKFAGRLDDLERTVKGLGTSFTDERAIQSDRHRQNRTSVDRIESRLDEQGGTLNKILMHLARIGRE